MNNEYSMYLLYINVYIQVNLAYVPTYNNFGFIYFK